MLDKADLSTELKRWIGHVPFGGNGESGIGHDGTEADVDAMTEWKWMTIQTL